MMISFKFALRVVCVFLAVVLGGGTESFATSPPPTPDKNNPTAVPKWWNLPMQFVVVRHSTTNCEPNCPEWIAAEGRITGDTSSRLQKLLANPAYRKLPLVLTSPGGDINSAIRMGRTLRKYGMTTAVGYTVLQGCTNDDFMAGKCKPDPVLLAYNGTVSPWSAFCASACPLALLGGTVRIVNPLSLVGLHEPTATARPYIDKYMIHYRLVNGHKQEISRDFIKRTYLPEKTTIGVTPALRSEFVSYIKDMGGSPEIIDEMGKAAPKDMDWIPAVGGRREHLGLVSAADASPATPKTLDDLSADFSCDPKKTPFANCVFVKAKTMQTAAAEPVTDISKPTSNTPPVLAPSPNGPMSFTVMRLASSKCEPLCPEWIAAEGDIGIDTPLKLDRLLNDPKLRRLPIAFNSSGGLSDPAMLMGRLIRKYHMTTTVAATTLAASRADSGYAFSSLSRCEGACPLAFLGGVDRVIEPGAQFGLKPPFSDGSLTEAQRQKYKSYFDELSLPPEVMVEWYYGSYHPTNEISAASGKRESLELTNLRELNLNSLISGDLCHVSGKLPTNCMEPAKKEPQKTAAP